MIGGLHITDLGVIDDAELELGPGLTVITGETGAGKTMVLSGLDLLTGGKADPATVRAGADAAVVEGWFDAPTARTVAQEVQDAGAVLDDDGSLLVARTVAAHGRSRTVLGGRAVPQAVLGELTSGLVTVHGQTDQVRLRTPARQRAVLDAYGGDAVASVLLAYREVWEQRQAATSELAALRDRAAARSREVDELRQGLAEVERVDPQPGEDVALAAEAERLRHAGELGQDVLEARTMLTGGDAVGEVQAEALGSAGEQLARAVRALERAEQHDATLEPQSAALRDLTFRLADVAADLAGYLDALDADPARLEQIETRRSELAHLTRSYGQDADAVLAWASEAGLRLIALEDDDGRVATLAEHVADLEARLATLADELHRARAAAAGSLVDAVDAELEGLAMGGAHLSVEVRPVDPGPSGADEVTILLQPHPGAPARPVAQGASGGELSRVMLAIEVALAGRQTAVGDALTMVFDEVDAGVGGKAATRVGERLARLAQHHQVLVITHLAQVAAFASTHVVVEKSSSAERGVTRSDVHVVEGEDRVVELARMLSGSEGSGTARAHAAELLEAAAVRR